MDSQVFSPERLIKGQLTVQPFEIAVDYEFSQANKYFLLWQRLSTIAASLFGGIVERLAFPQHLLILFDDTYDLPDIGVNIYMNLVVPAVLLAVLFGIVAAYLFCSKMLSLNAAAAMRPPLPQAGHQIFLEKMPGFWNGLLGSGRIVFRNILCNKRRALLNCIGVAGFVSIICALVTLLMAILHLSLVLGAPIGAYVLGGKVRIILRKKHHVLWLYFILFH